MKDRSDLMVFWKLLSDSDFTGTPSQLTEQELWKLGLSKDRSDLDIEAAIRGLREFQKREIRCRRHLRLSHFQQTKMSLRESDAPSSCVRVGPSVALGTSS